MVDEVLPGDTFNCHMTAFGRFGDRVASVMDNMFLDTFFFFCAKSSPLDELAKVYG